MKIGFSTLVCPAWDLPTAIAQATTLGYAGIEIRGLKGEFDLLRCAALAGNPDLAKKAFADAGIELICLSPSVTLDSRKRSRLDESRRTLVEHIELAGRLGCPFVKLFTGEVQRFDHHDAALSRIARELHELIPTAVKHGVTLLIENTGDFTRSDDMWYLIDAVSHPAVQCCWNQTNAGTRREFPSVSIPRLGIKIAVSHVCDADFDETGVLKAYKLPGQGQVGVARQIELLRGVGHEGWLVFEWPKAWIPDLPEPSAALPAVAQFLKAELSKKQAVLSAYKGDKNPAKFASRGSASAPAT